ncbi:hypothetical protein O181_098931 [Austropuccinia psidii MF-1]|uniref:Uncharacterized protein n=1 Tax=Austropuccinia psidii MF-1 TaxID=1389203 RepID=A0A9Q3JCF3_9BASI|nr:hypothetical protein [Austropuccinia psidii MF-1]
MRNHKLLPQLPGELENAVKCRCNQNCTLDDIANTLQDVRKRANIGKFSVYRSSSFKEKQLLRVELKDKPRESVRCDYETDDNITINQQYYVCYYKI